MESTSQIKSMKTGARNLKNFALQPFLQVKIGLYCILLSLIFAGGALAVVYLHMAQLVQTILSLTGAPEEVRDLLIQFANPVKLEIVILLLGYILTILLVTLRYTHRLVGPTIAFRRHIRKIEEEHLNYRTILRSGDAFTEVADDLNRLSQKLEKKQSKGGQSS